MGAFLGVMFIREANSPVPSNNFGLPLPRVMHRVLTEEEIGGREVMIFGDVHGCLDELKQLISVTKSTTDNCVFVFCGDILNKGPKNCETLAFIRSLDALIVRGNHEEHVLMHYLKSKKSAEDSLAGKYKWVANLSDDDIDYLMQLPYTISIPSYNCIVVHAGLFPWRPLQTQHPSDMTMMRNIVDIDGGKPHATKRTDEGLPWASAWTGPEHVYYGHSSCTRLKQYNFATGLDSGCVYGGKLTAKLLRSPSRLVSVNAMQQYRKTKKQIIFNHTEHLVT
ncbi:hypothetical protein NP493_332g03007 [Ridgeia piscesae]|uniref:Calcineurin-like phosphoesterase domain-containing protein n=1 Tax=Ridgeia piscesae TaxID=27915 RepID=A0AAD9L460_RIDPI|nr:hypothetical protein NP493_332g03007 [Ridgeia piscesae]